MPNVGPLEIVVVLIIALVVFGPKRIPELGNSLGKGIRSFKSSLGGEDEETEQDRGASERPRQLPGGSTVSVAPSEETDEVASSRR